MKLNVSWEKLRLFYIVAKHTNITAAANHLNISQSALSRSITWLEERLKISLFYRHSRGLILTEKGKILYDTLEKMMNSISIAESTLLEMDKEPKGPLTICSSSGVISKLLLHDANAFLERYPELELTIVLRDSIPDFTTGEVEAAVFPYIQDKDHFLNQEYLLSFYMKLYASREYLEKFGVPQTPRDLDHHRLLSYGTHPHPFANLNWHLSLGCPEGTVRRPYMQVNLGEKIRTLIRQGIGIGTLAFHENTPDLSVNAELVQILTHIEGPQIDFYYIYPKYLEDSLRIKALGDHFKFVIEQQGLAIQQNLKSQPRKIAHRN